MSDPSPLPSFLSGVRVLDLSRHLPGPLATLYLSDMGAEVLKVEPPNGDDIRALGPRDAEGAPVFYDTINSGKSSLRLDLRTAADRERLLALAGQADVVVESFRPGVLERLGVGYDTLRTANPALVFCSLSGFGSTGPHARRAGHDNVYLALAGVLDRNGDPDGYRHFYEPPVADCSASLTAVIAILGALRRRERSGLGCRLEVALADAVMPLQMLQVAEMEAAGVPARARGGLYNGGTAYYQAYRTRDGRNIVLGAVEPKFWATFCEAAGRPEWIGRQSEPAPQTRLIGELRDYFAALSWQEARERFESIDCCFAPVLELQEALDSEQVRARGLARKAADGRTQLLFPVLVDGRPPPLRTPVRQAAGFADGGDG